MTFRLSLGKGGTFPLRVGLIMVAVAVFIAGCFSSGTRVAADDPVSLVADRDVRIDPDTGRQLITIRAVTSRGEPALIDFDQVQVLGMTSDGATFAVPTNGADAPVQTLAPGQAMYGLDELDAFQLTADDDALVLAIDVQALAEMGITHLKIIVGPYTLVIEIRPSEGDPLPSPDPDPDPEPDPEPEPDPDPVLPPTQTRETRLLRRGTNQETRVYIIRSSEPGPTVMIVGGVHGGERAGWMAAGEIKDWTIDRGTLVVLPEANRPAVQRLRRTGTDGIDLNRQFPVGSTPRTALAREIWNLVLEFQPVALMDLHEGWGLRREGHRFPDGTLSVGQTLITYPARDARKFAEHATAYVDQYHVLGLPKYSYMVIGPPVAGSLARKAGQELGIPAFIVEPSQEQTRLETRIRWHKAFVELLLKWYGLVDEDRVIVPKEYRAQGSGSFDAGGAPNSRTFLAA